MYNSTSTFALCLQAKRQMEAALFLVDKISLFLMGSHTWWAELSGRVCYRNNAVLLSLPASFPAPLRLALFSLARLIADRIRLARHSTIQRGIAGSLNEIQSFYTLHEFHTSRGMEYSDKPRIMSFPETSVIFTY